MEKIKQALQQARRERAESVSSNSTVQSRAELDVTSEQSIEYSQTKVIEKPASKLSFKRLISPGRSDPFTTAFKMLRTQVLHRMTENGWNALAVTSPGPGDGKTFVCANLAISLAMELHHTVLLVDLDLRKPSVHEVFEFTSDLGVTDCLMGDAELKDVLVNPGIDRLVVLPGRRNAANSSELLSSPRSGRMIEELKTRYPSRFVICDLPPILAADDAIAFSPFVDAVILVIQDGKTTRAEVERTMELLGDTPVLGTVLNRSAERTDHYNY